MITGCRANGKLPEMFPSADCWYTNGRGRSTVSRGERPAGTASNMVPHNILGIPIIERAAPGGFVAQQERELNSQLQAAIDMLRCPSCGSLNYETTLFVFSTGIEK